jgi:NitT/TauT family transport system ATP-binding protein
MVEVYPSQVRESQVHTRNLSVSHGSESVIVNVDLDVRQGEFVSIVGLSGSGKTTLLNALAGFLPSSGEIQVPGRIGVVFQDYSVFPWLTVYENIAFGLKDFRRPDEDEIVRRHLKLIQMEAQADKFPAELSGGQVQRVSIARALAPNPDVIFMDEPYGALDRYTREKMQEWLLEIWTEDQKTVLFITHDIEEAVFLSDRVLVLSDGRIDQEFQVDLARPRTEDLKFSSRFIEIKKRVLEQLRKI